MFSEKIIFETFTNLVTTSEHMVRFELLGNPSPILVLVKGGNIDTTGYEYGLRASSNSFEGSLDTIKNSFHDTYSISG